jgi:hypothetical protein
MVRGYVPPEEGVTAFTTYTVPTSPPWQMVVADGGRFVLFPTAGPYEETLSDHQIKKYIAFIEAGIKYGKKD